MLAITTLSILIPWTREVPATWRKLYCSCTRLQLRTSGRNLDGNTVTSIRKWQSRRGQPEYVEVVFVFFSISVNTLYPRVSYLILRNEIIDGRHQLLLYMGFALALVIEVASIDVVFTWIVIIDDVTNSSQMYQISMDSRFSRVMPILIILESLFNISCWSSDTPISVTINPLLSCLCSRKQLWTCFGTWNLDGPFVQSPQHLQLSQIILFMTLNFCC